MPLHEDAPMNLLANEAERRDPPPLSPLRESQPEPYTVSK
jgi:hypothetical protein